MVAVTAIPRIAPLILLSGRDIPQLARRWLSLIAPAILSALLLPELILDNSGQISPVLSFINPRMLAAIPAFIVAFLTKSLFLTVVAGIVASAILRRI
jgi:branched-subunit amino acid transport protein